ncbi:MAG: hypothetical protein JSU73_13105 [candidate division WOR-3 bacterium]|nr:MAG: hypothetical protein JSU73_13105 [candidate division WOR-3 bacterium]
MCPFTVDENGKWKCDECTQITHVRGLFICPDDQTHQELGPQPTGVPRKAPCPDPAFSHEVWPSGLTCVQCYPWDMWFDPGPEPPPGG